MKYSRLMHKGVKTSYSGLIIEFRNGGFLHRVKINAAPTRENLKVAYLVRLKLIMLAANGRLKTSSIDSWWNHFKYNKGLVC